MVSKDHIIVVGDGIAGSTTARKIIEEKPSISVTLIAPSKAPDTEQINFDTRHSTPLISESTARSLGLDPDKLVRIVEGEIGIGEQSGFLRKLIFRRVERTARELLERDPLVSIDAQNARNQLFKLVEELARSTSDIRILKEDITELVIEKNRVVGIRLKKNDELISANLVIDATGRPAHITKKVPDQYVETREKYHPSTIIGCYIDLHERVTPEKLKVSFLSNHVIAILAPTEHLEGSHATHLLLIEGDSKTIGEAHSLVKGLPGTADQKRLGVMRELVKNTEWERILDGNVTMDRTVLFKHTTSLYRQAHIEGFALVGDAQGYLNPINGVGYRQIASDVDTLVDLIKNSDTLSSAITAYKVEMDGRFRTRLRNADRNYLGINLMQRLIGKK